MLTVPIVFIFFAAIAFLGFIINALFYRFKISSILPLMLIGFVVGPLLGIVNTGPGSIVSVMVPYVSGIAIAFILFDVGLNIEVKKLAGVFARANAFTFVGAVVVGLALSLLAYYALGWNILYALVFGFAVSGPSSVIVPTLMKLVKVKPELKTVLIYEGVATDIIQLMVPLTIIALIVNPVSNNYQLGGFLLTEVFGSIFLALALAVLWLYVLNKYKEQSKSYSWILTISMVVATYGIAVGLDLSGAIAVFVFGMVFANTEHLQRAIKRGVLKRLTIGRGLLPIKDHQKQIGFFTSTFFFVYIGMLFNIGNINLLLAGTAIMAVVVIVVLRYITSMMLNPYFSEKSSGADRKMVYFDISRGLSPAIIATIPLALGINIPGFLDVVLLVILFTNAVSTAGIMATYRSERMMKPNGSEDNGARR